MKKNLIVLGSIAVVAFILIQLVPYRVSNPPVQQEPAWDSPRTRALAVRACYECHSNETKVPWYGKVAPVSWLVTRDVRDGREELNFSEWNASGGQESDDAAETVRDGSMPPRYYTWFGLHSDAKLSAQEKQDLASGFERTLGR